MTSETKDLEKKKLRAGGGVWIRRSDRKEFYVDVTFYPTVRLWINAVGGRQEISRETLEAKYERLRL